MPLPYDPRAAIRHLRQRDPALGAAIARVGRYRLEDRTHLSAFEALLHSIVYQQLSGHAAASIHARVLDLMPRRRPSARAVHALPDEALRAAGLSRAKVLAVRDLAAKATARRIPGPRTLDRLDDDAIVERLCEIRGIGRWTVEMLLIFTLGRPDVLPATDLGVRRGFLHVFGGDAMPAPAALLEHGERWRPYRSVASWYLWRASEWPQGGAPGPGA